MRPTWNEYFLEIAKTVAKRSTCDRKHVGCVIVSSDMEILTTGYNGSPTGLPHCDDVGHLLKEVGGRQSCFRTVHSETNAIIQAARNGIALNGSTLYVTCSPCWDCALKIVQVGIKKVFYGERYQSRYDLSNTVEELFETVGIEYVSLEV
jgi:dCMP deaminase